MSIKVKCKTIEQRFTGDNGYRVICCTPLEHNGVVKLNNRFQFSIAGNNFPYIDINKEYELEIELDVKSKYPASYILISCPSIENLDVDNLTREQSFEILMGCTSSENIANSILDVYPDYIKRALTDGADSIDTKPIKGVGTEYNKAYCRNLNEKYKYLSILNKYKDYKFDIIDCEKLYRKFTTLEDIEKNIRDSPYYVMIDILNKTFYKSDLILKSIRPDLGISKQRCEYCVLDILSKNEEDGNTYMDANIMYLIMRDGYDIGKKHYAYNVPELLPIVVDTCNDSEVLYYNPKNKRLAKMNTWIAEKAIKQFIDDKIIDFPKLDIDYESYRKLPDDSFGLVDNQMNALKNTCEYGACILAGYSGAGKSKTVKNIVRMLKDNRISFTLLAPTGRAARVLSDATHETAFTIHRRCLSQDGINSDVIIIDEYGMVGIDLMMMILNSVENPNARFIFIGDPAQIPSISYGKVFQDMIDSNVVPKTILTEVFRYKSNGALFVATNTREGNNFFDEMEYSNGIYSAGKNFKFIELSDEEDILNTTVSEYKRMLQKSKKKDIAVLSCQNVGNLGTYELNRRIQEEINPPKPNENILTRTIEDCIIVFRQGDIILNTKNDYKAVTKEEYNKMVKSNGILNLNDLGSEFIANGQTGIILNILKDGMIAQFDEQEYFISKGKLKQLLLGYSISIHKSQGSTIERVINIVTNRHKYMLNRGIEYVANTRASIETVDIGERSAYEYALGIVENERRNTFLKDLLLEDEKENG